MNVTVRRNREGGVLRGAGSGCIEDAVKNAPAPVSGRQAVRITLCLLTRLRKQQGWCAQAYRQCEGGNNTSDSKGRHSYLIHVTTSGLGNSAIRAPARALALGTVTRAVAAGAFVAVAFATTLALVNIEISGAPTDIILIRAAAWTGVNVVGH